MLTETQSPERLDQAPVIPEGAMRVGPNTDAVVWKLCDTNQTVEL